MGSLLAYFLVLGIGTLLSLAGINSGKKVNLYTVLGICVIILFAGGRYHVGTDMGTYTAGIIRNASLPLKSVLFSSGESWLFYLIARVTWPIGGRVLTWSVLALLTVLPVYLALRDEYPELNFEIAFFVFLIQYYTTSFNITKQILACAYVFYALKYVLRGNALRYILGIIIAGSFHITAFLALPIWFFWDHRNNCPISGIKRWVLLFVVAIAVYSFQDLIRLASSSLEIMKEFSSYAETSTRGQNRDFYVYSAELIMILLMRRYIIPLDERNDIMINMMIVSVLIGFTGFLHPQVKRIAYYYAMPSRIVLFGYLPGCFTTESSRLAKMLIVVWEASLFIITAYYLGESHLLPYRFDLFSPW